MAKEIKNIKKELHSLQHDVYLRQRITCSKEENKKYADMVKQGQPLPPGIYAYKDNETGEDLHLYYTIYIPDELTEAERKEYILLMQLYEMKTMRKYLYFFVILAIVSIIGSLILGAILTGI